MNIDFIGLNNRMRLAEAWNSTLHFRDINERTKLRKKMNPSSENKKLVENLEKFGWLNGEELNYNSNKIIKWGEKVLKKNLEQKSSGINKKSLKSFMGNILDNDSINDSPLLEFFSNPKIIDLISQYFLTLPVFTSAKLLFSPVRSDKSSTYQSSQLLHKDTASTKLLKFVFNIRDVSKKNGPFSFLDSEDSTILSEPLNYRSRGVPYRVDDETAKRFVSPSSTKMNIGPAGTYTLVDTSRCFHFGARTFEAERLILICTFSLPYRADFRKTNLPLKNLFDSSKFKDDKLLRKIFSN